MRDADRHDDDGTSLVELIITMAIFTVVLLAITQLGIGFQRSAAETTSRQDQVETGRFAVEGMTGTLRTAVMPSQLTTTCTACTQDAFVLGQPYSVQFYANYKNSGNAVGPSRITYSVAASGADAGKLVQKIQTPDSNIPTASGYVYCNAELLGASAICKAHLSVLPLARGVQTDTGVPVFLYYDNAGSQLLGGGSGSLTADQLKRVVAIEVTLTTQAQNATRAVPTTYIQRVTLPNAQAVIRNNESKES